MIHNLSVHSLTEEESLVFIKDLSFVPTLTKTFKQEIKKSWSKFETSMLKQYFFRNSIHEKPPPFKRKSNWIPHQELGSISTPSWKTYSNLTLKENITLNNSKNIWSIIIKPYDKGGIIYIINTRDCLNKIHIHLQDHNAYKLLTHNPINGIAHNTRTFIHYMHFQQIIYTATMEFLLPLKNTRTPLFYGSSTIHKSICPLHPLAVGCDAPTYRLQLIQPLANNLPSHIKDTKHFLNLIENLPPLPPNNALLVTADVSWCHVPIQKQSTWWWHISCHSFHGEIQASPTYKLTTSHKSAQSSFSFLKVVSATFSLVYFVMSKKEHLWNKEKCFSFHLENSFHSWDNQILNFLIFKCHEVIKCPSTKHKTHLIE